MCKLIFNVISWTSQQYIKVNVMNDKELEEIRVLLSFYLRDLTGNRDDNIEAQYFNSSTWGTPYFDTDEEMNAYIERVSKAVSCLEEVK